MNIYQGKMIKRSFCFVLLNIWNALPGASGLVELWPSGREATNHYNPPPFPSLQLGLRNTHSRPPHPHSSRSPSFHPFFMFSSRQQSKYFIPELCHSSTSLRLSAPFQSFNQHLVYTHTDSILAFRHHTGAAEEFSDRCLLMLSHAQTHTHEISLIPRIPRYNIPTQSFDFFWLRPLRQYPNRLMIIWSLLLQDFGQKSFGGTH